MSKYLDNDGLLYFWQKIKATFAKASHTHTTADVTGLDAALTNANKVTDVKVNGTSVVTNKSANITVDSTLSITSNNPIKNSTVAAKFNSVNSTISRKQDKLTFDSTPTANSTKPVTSGGVKSALDAKQNKLTFDSTPTENSTNPVTSGGVAEALTQINDYFASIFDAKQDKLTFDDSPKSASSNPVTSNGIKQAIDTASLNIFTELNKKQGTIPNADKLSIDSSGIIAAKNLPSYVDDVIEVLIDSTQSNGSNWLFDDNNPTNFNPETGKIYVIVGLDENGTVKDAGEYQNTQWRWTGSQYVRLTDGSGVSPITNSEIDAIVAQ